MKKTVEKHWVKRIHSMKPNFQDSTLSQKWWYRQGPAFGSPDSHEVVGRQRGEGRADKGQCPNIPTSLVKHHLP